jgi:hypothetical protein
MVNVRKALCPEKKNSTENTKCSRRTVSRADEINNDLLVKLNDSLQIVMHFSIALDDSTDTSNTS